MRPPAPACSTMTAVFRLLAALPAAVPLIMQDAAEDDVARVCGFLLGHAQAQGWAA